MKFWKGSHRTLATSSTHPQWDYSLEFERRSRKVVRVQSLMPDSRSVRVFGAMVREEHKHHYHGEQRVKKEAFCSELATRMWTHCGE